MSHVDGQIVLRDRIVSGRVSFDSHIRQIEPTSSTDNLYILPDFIDGHVHGGGGVDTMDGVGAIETLFRFHLTHGTTTILPTTITAPWSDVMDAFQSIEEVRTRGVKDGPHIHGHIWKGPFVSPHKLGAQPPCMIEAPSFPTFCRT